MTVYREGRSQPSALAEYIETKRREFIAASGSELGDLDASRLEGDLSRLNTRIDRQLGVLGVSNLCYLVVGLVQSGKTGHQLGMLASAADKFDVAVIFTGVTEALNAQTSYRIGNDLGTLPSNPVSTLNVPTRANAERDASFLEGVLHRARQRRAYRANEAMWPERLPILVSMKTKPRVDALKWLFQQVAEQLGEGVSVLFIDDEADQASPNAKARRDEEAATYSELKELRDAATRHVWLSYTATPQAVFLTERDGALRPDYCAVSHPGVDYFGVVSLMSDRHADSRIEVHDWVGRAPGQIPHSLRRAICDLLVAGWLRLHHPDWFYRRDDGPAQAGMRSVQMLLHTSSKQDDHADAYQLVERTLQDLRTEIEDAISGEEPEHAPIELAASWAAASRRLRARIPSAHDPDLGLEQLWQVGRLSGSIERRVVNSDSSRPTAQSGPLPNARSGWEAHPLWIVIGGEILGRGLTIPQLVTTYFTRLAQGPSSEDTVAQQMRFCGYRSTYAHVVTVHALPDIFTSFDYLAAVEVALLATAEAWEEKDRNLRESEPALWYVAPPNRRMRPTRLAVRTRELYDRPISQVVLSLRQFAQPTTFMHNARAVRAWLDQGSQIPLVGEWSMVECQSVDALELLSSLRLHGRDDADREVALELMSPRLGDLGLSDLPFAIAYRKRDVVDAAADGVAPNLETLPVRSLAAGVPSSALQEWTDGWRPTAGMSPDPWFIGARIQVPHIGDGQRRPLDAMPMDAVTVLIEPMSVRAGQDGSRVGGGIAISIVAPDRFSIRVIGVENPSAS